MATIITIEGIDGIGKATIADALYHQMHKCGLKVAKASFPVYESPTGQMVTGFLHGKLMGNPIEVDPYLASMPYTMDRYAFWKEHADIIENQFVILDRSHLSNFFFQGAKIYFEDLIWFYTYSSAPTSVRFYDTAAELCDDIENLKRGYCCVVKYPTSDDRLEIVNGPKLHNLYTRFIISQIQYGHVIASAYDTVPGLRSTGDRITDLRQFTKWLYDMEINHTILKQCNFINFYLGNTNARTLVKDSTEQMKDRADLDLHEKNAFYRELVERFSQIIVHNEIPIITPDTKGFTLYPIQATHIATDKTESSEDYQYRIALNAYYTACRIREYLALLSTDCSTIYALKENVPFTYEKKDKEEPEEDSNHDVSVKCSGAIITPQGVGRLHALLMHVDRGGEIVSADLVFLQDIFHLSDDMIDAVLRVCALVPEKRWMAEKLAHQFNEHFDAFNRTLSRISMTVRKLTGTTTEPVEDKFVSWLCRHYKNEWTAKLKQISHSGLDFSGIIEEILKLLVSSEIEVKPGYRDGVFHIMID